MKQLEKNSHIYEDLKLMEEMPEEPKIKTRKIECPACDEGEIKVIMEFEDKYITACNCCHYKKSVKR